MLPGRVSTSLKQEPGQGSHHEIAVDQQRRRGLHRACGSVHLLRRGVGHAVKTCHFSRLEGHRARMGNAGGVGRVDGKPVHPTLAHAVGWTASPSTR